MFFKMNFIYFVICSCFYFIMSKIASIAASPLKGVPLIDSCLIRIRTVLASRRRPAFKHQYSIFLPEQTRSSCSIVENNGFEPLTPCVQGRCSSQLS